MHFSRWIFSAIALLLHVCVLRAQSDSNAITSDYLNLTKSPTGAALRSLAFPGWGQLYVEHYVQAPVFAAAAGFLWFNIVANHVDYKNYKADLSQHQDVNSYEYQVANSKMVAAIDNRDLNAMYLLGVYLLSIIDAYAGAHLYDFKILGNSFHWNINANQHLLGSPRIALTLSYCIK